ncbi:MAG TPA: hypothetical protein P5089_02260 [Candidatus Portnoybacteria bacterium]|nr:hypothetical protein [Candidatus Portnoybacteria bacterium]
MKKYLGLFVGLALLVPAVAGATQFQGGETVAFNETIRENVYISGGTVNIAGTIEGDLYVAGGTVNILGTVSKDVVVVGGTVIITGTVNEDLRVLGGNVTVGGKVGHELAAAGGNINVMSSAAIGDGAYIAGGNISMNGSVGMDLVLAGSEIAIGNGVKVGGNFDYYSQKEAKVDASVKISGITTFHQQAVKNQHQTGKAGFLGMFAFMTIWGLLGLAAAVILACLLFYIWRRESEELIETVFAAPGKELLRGFITFFILPIAAIICCITVIGLPLGFFLGFAFWALFILGAAATGLLWAALLAKFVFKRKATDINWWLIILAVIVLSIIKAIPFVGCIIGCLVFLTGFGVMSNMIYKKLMPRK